MVLGHERQIEYLKKALENGRLAHAYLFYGPEGVGKFTAARHFAGFFDNPEIIILDRKHTLVSEKEERKDIPIEDVRELKRRFALAPEGERWRIAIINEAEKLSPAAADAFLKLLEEPGKNTVFILIAETPELLSQTIVSRSVPVRFSLIPDNVIVNAVRQPLGIAASSDFGRRTRNDNDAEIITEILLLAAGRPGVAIRALSDQDYLLSRRKILKSVTEILAARNLPEALYLAGKFAGDEEKRRNMVEYIIRICRKKMHEEDGARKEYAARLKNMLRIAGILETTNVNPRLALDAIFMEAIRGG